MFASALLTAPPGKSPKLTSESPNVASSAAIARSQPSTIANAPPKQKPLIAAMVGFGYKRSVRPRHSTAMRVMRSYSAGLSRSAVKNSLRSMPAQNAGPEPVMTTTVAPSS